MAVEVDAMLEGSPDAGGGPAALRELLERAQAGCAAAVPLVLAAKKARRPRWPLPALASVSLVLCDDAYIRALNAAHRGKDAATDVLSFEVPDEPGEAPPPVKLLGDLVVSLDTAARQAAERGHSLEDELRILLVHGCLHLAGFDHERGGAQLREMAAAEAGILEQLGWRGQGLIEAAGALAGDSEDEGEGGGGGQGGSSSTGGGSSDGSGGRAASGSEASVSSQWSADSVITRTGGFRSSGVRLVAIDMDGTLLDSRSKILPSSAAAIRAALRAGVRVVLATGKARPAAIAACEAAGLAGERLLVSRGGPGVFLQGLAVHGDDGSQLSDAALPAAVVAAALSWAAAQRIAAVAFHGDTCSALEVGSELVELHTRYYEPLAAAAPSLDALLAGEPVRKLLFMADEPTIAGRVLPHWAAALGGGGGGGLSGAQLLQAVPNMLEVVPAGVNKWAGLTVLLDHLGVGAGELMAIGDGGNDAEMVRNAGVGVAMANAVVETLAAASVKVSSNDDGGVAEALERFVL
ncbi:MAG: HAD-like protein [Monoraphidium minutum]|nr:MAG: HAD-like protein [Monoraphidium minutum]